MVQTKSSPKDQASDSSQFAALNLEESSSTGHEQHLKESSLFHRKNKSNKTNEDAIERKDNRIQSAQRHYVTPPLFSIRGLALLVVRSLFAICTPIAYFLYKVAVQGIQSIQWVSNNSKLAILLNPFLDLLADFVTHYRGIFVTLFINPGSMAWELTDYLRDWMWDLKMPPVGDVSIRKELHEARVAHVQQQINDAVAQGAKKLCTARPGYLAMSMKAGTYKNKWVGIDVHALRDVVEIDEDKGVVRVEPGCNMGRLSRELIRRGWTLQVLPELDELTVGGLINGFGIETSSHKYGLFQHICTAFEIVLPSGEYVFCDKDHHAELFATIPWSHGTLGFLVGADIKIIRAAPYVRLEYFPCQSREKGIKLFEEASRNKSNDFVESLVYSREESVVMIGKLAHTPTDGPINKIGKWYKKWFFTHVQSFLDSENSHVEYIPLRDYYHRHTSSIFWEIRDIVPFGNSVWYRYLFAWAGPPKVALLKLTTTGKLKHLWETMHVAQDLLVPMTTLSQALDVFHNELTVYPLWLCPMRMLSPPENLLAARNEEPGHSSLTSESSKYASYPVTTPSGSLTPPHPADQLYVDIGAYGVPHAPNFHHIHSLERIEAYVRSVQGYQALYADSCLSRQEFREMFDHRLYDKVRRQYHAYTHLPEIWEKVNRNARA